MKLRPSFPVNDSRRVPLTNALNLQLRCVACGTVSRNLTPVLDPGDTVPGDPPMVCVDFATCCRTYRIGTTPEMFARVVLGIKA